jgi:lysyl-tRNA synthetase class 2
MEKKGKTPQTTPESSAPAAEISLPEQIRVRYGKREALLARHENPYRNGFKPSSSVRELQAKYAEATREQLADVTEVHSVAGRVIGIRDFGKGGFLRIRERTGDFQFFIDKALLGEAKFAQFKELDLGDFVYGAGRPMRTKTNELSLHCAELELLTKSLRPLPEKFHGLSDVETRYRQRYADLIVSQQTRETFVKRSKTIEAIRDYLVRREFVEVETPMLHAVQGGTIARPFTTHHNALDMPLYLRIAPELYLKRLVVGGMERVFEINRNFRNEGISIKHNPEFTMLEFYQAYATFEDLMTITEEMIAEAAQKVLGSTRVNYQGTELEFGAPWRRITVEESILEYSGFKDKARIRDREALLAYGKKAGIHMDPKLATGDFIMAIFDAEVEKHLIQPTFVTMYPVDVSPLARRNEKDAFVTDRFELYIYAREIANGFSELNDPVDQRERFEKQVEAKVAGRDDACDMDEDYIRALEFGLPPTAGEGIGIDRLVMLLTDSPSIRDVILFPLLRPEV